MNLRFSAKSVGSFLGVIFLTYLGLLAVTFFIGRVIPIDPVLAIVGDRAPEHLVAKVREELGLNKPLWHQFYIYLSKVVQGDFGTSVLTSNPVLADIKRTFPATIELAWWFGKSSRTGDGFDWLFRAYFLVGFDGVGAVLRQVGLGGRTWAH